MLRISLCIIGLLFWLPLGAQNIIQNGSFENYISCPTGGAQVQSHCVAWRNHGNSSPDFFHACSIGLVDVPNNAFGSEMAANGDGYGGFLAYFPVEAREYLGASIAPLTVGASYEMSMSVSVADNSLYGCNGLGVLFYKNGAPSAQLALMNMTPQVLYPTVFTNQMGWVRVSAGFIADSAYTDIVVGSFLNNTNITVTTISGTAQNTYLYVDSIVLIPTPPISYTIPGLMLCGGDTIYVPYTKLLNVFSSGNVFTLQLSDATGGFSSPVNIGTLTSTASGTIMGVIPKTIAAGTGYRMRLTSSNQAYTSLDNGADIQIKTHPAVTATVNSPVCEGSTLQLNATSLPGVTYSWAGPGTFTSALANPAINPAAASHTGDYIVTTTLNGCKGKDTVSVTVNPTPVISAAGNNGPLCAGSLLNLSSQSNMGTYSWTGPSFTSTLQNPQVNNVTTANGGVYTVTATLNGCTSQPVSTTVVVNAVPVVSAATNNSPICEGDLLNLQATGTAGATYSWTGPSFSSAQQNPQIANATLANSGVYTVTATQNGCTSLPVTTNAVIKLTPAMPNAGSNSPVCTGGALNLLSNSTTPGVTYDWVGPNNFTSNQQNPIIDPVPANAGGVYTVTASLNGCTSQPGTVTAVVNTVTYLGAYASPNDTLCENDSLNVVTVPINGGSSPTFQWFKNNNAIPGATQLKYLDPGAKTGDTFYCRMIAGNVCNTPITLYSNKIGITVVPQTPSPTVTISAMPANPLPGNPVTFTAAVSNAGANPGVQWLRNGQAVAGATQTTWVVNGLAPYEKVSVRITSREQCPEDRDVESNSIEINFPTGVQEYAGNDVLRVFPNPNNGQFTVRGNMHTGDVLHIKIVNMMGQLVYGDAVKVKNEQADILLAPGLPAGIYMLSLETAKGLQKIKLEIQ